MIVDQPYESRDPANGDVDVDPAVIETVQRLCYEIPNIKKIYKTCVVPPKKKGDQSGFSFTAKVLLNQEERRCDGKRLFFGHQSTPTH